MSSTSEKKKSFYSKYFSPILAVNIESFTFQTNFSRFTNSCSLHKQLVRMCQTFEHIICLKLSLPFRLWENVALQGCCNTLSAFKGNLVFIFHTQKPLLLSIQTIQSSSTLGFGSNVEAANWPHGKPQTLCCPTKFNDLLRSVSLIFSAQWVILETRTYVWPYPRTPPCNLLLLIF